MKIKEFLRRRTPAEVFIAGFFIIIFLGAAVLSLPLASRAGEATPFLKSLFTSVSATCITGLVVYDTFMHWNAFGQAVILFLIQIGGLGFMTFATLFSLVFRRSIGHKERLMLAQTLNLNDMAGVVRLSKHVLLGTLAFEGAAAVILSVRFIPEYGFLQGIWTGVFISVSAFCNAGFDIMGGGGEFSSLTAFVDDPVVNLTVCALIVIGGLGFLVWEDIFAAKRFGKMSVTSRIVIISTAVLIILGFAVVFIFEYGNTETLGGLSFSGKVFASLFQSVSPRTAGMNTINLAALSETSKLVIIILMFIGGSSGSTAGGLKTNTIAVLFFATASVLRGRRDVTVMKRRISQETVLRAFALVSVSLFFLLIASFAVSVIDSQPFITALFECVSAFGTVGLTLGITPGLSSASLIILMLLMFLGRVGLLTASLALFLRQQKAENSIRYPEAKISIG